MVDKDPLYIIVSCIVFNIILQFASATRLALKLQIFIQSKSSAPCVLKTWFRHCLLDYSLLIRHLFMCKRCRHYICWTRLVFVKLKSSSFDHAVSSALLKVLSKFLWNCWYRYMTQLISSTNTWHLGGGS